jgi:hypothetical protein
MKSETISDIPKSKLTLPIGGRDHIKDVVSATHTHQNCHLRNQDLISDEAGTPAIDPAA